MAVQSILGGALSFVALSVNPIGGLAISIPFAVFALKYPVWLILLVGVPCAYVQVLAVDLAWTRLDRWPRWGAFFERRRSPRLERLAASGGAFLPTFVLAPIVGPWLVMAVMRYAKVPQRRVALPILLGLTVMASATCALWIYVPGWFKR